MKENKGFINGSVREKYEKNKHRFINGNEQTNGCSDGFTNGNGQTNGCGKGFINGCGGAGDKHIRFEDKPRTFVWKILAFSIAATLILTMIMIITPNGPATHIIDGDYSDWDNEMFDIGFGKLGINKTGQDLYVGLEKTDLFLGRNNITESYLIFINDKTTESGFYLGYDTYEYYIDMFGHDNRTDGVGIYRFDETKNRTDWNGFRSRYSPVSLSSSNNEKFIELTARSIMMGRTNLTDLKLLVYHYDVNGNYEYSQVVNIGEQVESTRAQFTRSVISYYTQNTKTNTLFIKTGISLAYASIPYSIRVMSSKTTSESTGATTSTNQENKEHECGTTLIIDYDFFENDIIKQCGGTILESTAIVALSDEGFTLYNINHTVVSCMISGDINDRIYKDSTRGGGGISIALGTNTELVVPPTSQTFTIDGNVTTTEWQDADSYTVDQTNDLKVYAVRDASYLYIALESLDEIVGAFIIEILNETVYGPSTGNGSENGPLYLDHGNIVNCTIYLDLDGEWLLLTEEGDYTLNYTTGEVNVTLIGLPMESGWTFYAYYNYTDENTGDNDIGSIYFDINNDETSDPNVDDKMVSLADTKTYYEGNGSSWVEISTDDTNWWDTNWTHRTKLTFDNGGQTENLVNFPVLVKLDSTNFAYADAKIDGTDLRFIDSDNSTTLVHHIENWSALGNSWLWVNVTQIDGSSSTDYIWMYYGNPLATDILNPEGTYNSDFAGVWHLNGTSTIRYDSTSNDRDGNSTNVTGIEGIIDSADQFDGTASNDIITYESCICTEFTVMVWANPSDPDTSIAIVGSRGPEEYGFDFKFESGDVIHGDIGNGTAWIVTDADASLNYATDVWYHITYVVNTTNYKIYINGTQEASNSFSENVPLLMDPDHSLFIGCAGVGYEHFQGIIDEVQIFNATMSADWIKATYLTQTNNFITYSNKTRLDTWNATKGNSSGHRGYEFKIPLTELNMTGEFWQSGDLIGFGCYVYNNETTNDYWIWWPGQYYAGNNPSTTYHNKPDEWGDLSIPEFNVPIAILGVIPLVIILIRKRRVNHKS